MWIQFRASRQMIIKIGSVLIALTSVSATTITPCTHIDTEVCARLLPKHCLALPGPVIGTLCPHLCGKCAEHESPRRRDLDRTIRQQKQNRRDVTNIAAPSHVLGRCIGTDLWRSEYGKCTTYASGGENHEHCGIDSDLQTDVLATSACPECFACQILPTEAPTGVTPTSEATSTSAGAIQTTFHQQPTAQPSNTPTASVEPSMTQSSQPAPACSWGLDPAGCRHLTTVLGCADNLVVQECPAHCDACSVSPTTSPTRATNAPTAHPTIVPTMSPIGPPTCIGGPDPDGCLRLISIFTCREVIVQDACPGLCDACTRSPTAQPSVESISTPHTATTTDASAPTTTTPTSSVSSSERKTTTQTTQTTTTQTDTFTVQTSSTAVSSTVTIRSRTTQTVTTTLSSQTITGSPLTPTTVTSPVTTSPVTSTLRTTVTKLTSSTTVPTTDVCPYGRTHCNACYNSSSRILKMVLQLSEQMRDGPTLQSTFEQRTWSNLTVNATIHGPVDVVVVHTNTGVVIDLISNVQRGDVIELSSQMMESPAFPEAITVSIADPAAPFGKFEFETESPPPPTCFGFACVVIASACSEPLRTNDVFGFFHVVNVVGTTGLHTQTCPCNSESTTTTNAPCLPGVDPADCNFLIEALGCTGTTADHCPRRCNACSSSTKTQSTTTATTSSTPRCALTEPPDCFLLAVTVGCIESTILACPISCGLCHPSDLDGVTSSPAPPTPGVEVDVSGSGSQDNAVSTMHKSGVILAISSSVVFFLALVVIGAAYTLYLRSSKEHCKNLNQAQGSMMTGIVGSADDPEHSPFSQMWAAPRRELPLPASNELRWDDSAEPVLTSQP